MEIMEDLSYNTTTCPKCGGMCETSETTFYTYWFGDRKVPKPIEGLICDFCSGKGVVHYLGPEGQIDLQIKHLEYKRSKLYGHR
jgi:RecJ-like exonuclease